MKRIHLPIFVCCLLFVCLLSACIGRDKAEQSAEVHESAQFQPQTQVQATAQPMVHQAPSGQQISVRTDHVRFLTGENDLFRPDGTVTRGQMAQIFSGLLQDDPFTPGEASFSDVAADSEAFAAVEEMAALGIMNGYGDGTFRPDQPITRAEMVAALCRMMNVAEVAGLAFPDVGAEYWAMGSVAAAMTSGWLSGFQDGSFYPDAPLTRAETVVLLNRARGRAPNKTAIDLVCASSPYQDVSQDFWAYYDIVDVSFTNEMMAYIMGEATDAQQGMMFLDDRMCHINAEHKLDYFQKGFHTIQDGLATDGLYYAPEDGYFLQRNHPGLQELDGSMFYVEREDGPFVVSYQLGYLYFGANGRYTTGDAEVDGYVDSIMAGIIQGDTASLLNEDKLRLAYNSILFGSYDYMTRPTGWERGSVGWSLECAKVMYETKSGSCYYWAASFLYLARRLGFQAYPVCGGVNENNALHAWVMIDHGDQPDDNDVNTDQSKNEYTRVIDEDEYIYDIELDWAYRTGAHGRVPVRPGRDLFKQTRGQSIVDYIFPGDTWEAPPMDDTDALGGEDGDNGDGTGNGGLTGGMVEGVDFVTTYVNNGDGTITVTVTYLTGDQAGTSTSYTIPDENWDPNAVTPAPPTTDVPVTDPPATDVPVTDPPATDVPVTDPPATEVPVTDAPVTEVPVTDVPVTDVPPETSIPETQAPVVDVPAAPAGDPNGTATGADPAAGADLNAGVDPAAGADAGGTDGTAPVDAAEPAPVDGGLE